MAPISAISGKAYTYKLTTNYSKKKIVKYTLFP